MMEMKGLMFLEKTQRSIGGNLLIGEKSSLVAWEHVLHGTKNCVELHRDAL